MRERYHQRADQHDDKVREKRRPGIETEPNLGETPEYTEE